MFRFRDHGSSVSEMGRTISRDNVRMNKLRSSGDTGVKMLPVDNAN
jgi:hypothetical protein